MCIWDVNHLSKGLEYAKCLVCHGKTIYHWIKLLNWTGTDVNHWKKWKETGMKWEKLCFENPWRYNLRGRALQESWMRFQGAHKQQESPPRTSHIHRTDETQGRNKSVFQTHPVWKQVDSPAGHVACVMAPHATPGSHSFTRQPRRTCASLHRHRYSHRTNIQAVISFTKISTVHNHAEQERGSP